MQEADAAALAADDDEDDTDSRLTPIGGEFRARTLETAFHLERAAETFRHARVLLIGSAFLNTLFFASDWRFYGTPQFYVAIPARAVVVLLALLSLALIRRSRTVQEAQAVMAAWTVLNAVAVAALVTSHSNIALFVVIMLPMIYYLAVPTTYRWTLAAGAGSSVLLLAGYELHHGLPSTSLGLGLAMLTLNVALAITVTRSNRLTRLQWLGLREQRRIAAKLHHSREMLGKLFAASPVPMVVTAGTGGHILHINDSAVALVGARREDIDRSTMTRFYADPADQQRLGALLEREGGVSNFELEVITASGDPRTVLLRTAVVETHEGSVNLTGIIDISDRKAIERRLEQLATTDPLTGLANRLSFFAQGRAELMRAARSGRPLSLLMVDLDHFKTINDSFGHQTGDDALRAFARLCRARLRQDDVVGRLGGEEFGVLLPGADADAAGLIAEELRTALAALQVPEAPGLCLTASIGLSPVHPHERDLDRAVGRADLALYAAKNDGRNRVVQFIEQIPPQQSAR